MNCEGWNNEVGLGRLINQQQDGSCMAALEWLFRSMSRQRDGSHVAVAWVARWVFGLLWGWRQDGSRHLGLSFSPASQFLFVLPTLYSIGLSRLFLSISPLNFSFPFFFFSFIFPFGLLGLHFFGFAFFFFKDLYELGQ